MLLARRGVDDVAVLILSCSGFPFLATSVSGLGVGPWSDGCWRRCCWSNYCRGRCGRGDGRLGGYVRSLVGFVCGLPDEAGGCCGERFLGWSEPREDLIQEGVADDGAEFAGIPDELDDVAQGPVVAPRGHSCSSGDRKCLVWISNGLPEEGGLCHRKVVRRSHELGEQVVGRRVAEAWVERAGVPDQLNEVPYGDVVDRCGGNLTGILRRVLACVRLVYQSRAQFTCVYECVRMCARTGARRFKDY